MLTQTEEVLVSACAAPSPWQSATLQPVVARAVRRQRELQAGACLSVPRAQRSDVCPSSGG
jgi:hypothetical protein